MLTVVGLDLAWTATHPSGVCLVRFAGDGDGDGDEGVLLDLDARLVAPAALAAALAALEGDVVVAVDAPLVVGGERMAERALARVFGKYHAAPYLATEAFLAGFGGLAGPRLMRELAGRGFRHALPGETHRRVAVEVYPHAAHVSLFGLAERIAYKKGRLDARRDGLRAYQLHLASLVARQWPNLADDARLAAILDPAAAAVPGRPLKALEDRLDAVTCAYTAWHLVTYGAGGTLAFGDPSTGLIAVPRWPNSMP